MQTEDTAYTFMYAGFPYGVVKIAGYVEEFS